MKKLLFTTLVTLVWGGLGFSQSRSVKTRILTFEAEAVDGVDLLILAGKKARIQHLEYREIRGPSIKLHEGLPREGSFRVVVRAKEGRPTVSVVQQPTRANGFELRVRLDDGPASGAAPLGFELWTVPVRPTPNPISIVLITIDSLRPDRLACYGHGRETSPALDALARNAVKFTNAFTTSSFTPPSHASMFTSRYVGDHGLLTWNPLPNEQLCLAEILSAHGYRTGASTALELLTAQNLGQGIETRHESAGEARDIVDDALEFLRASAGSPFFLWIHLYDVHRPYGRISGWSERFGAHDDPSVGSSGEHYNLQPADVAEHALSEADLAFIVDRYDAGIRYTDAQLAPLLAELSVPARIADTLLIVTADHGESLLDHEERFFTHDPFLYSAVTRIPLLVRFPGERWAGKEVDELVSVIDFGPTVLDLAGIEAPPTFQGQSLAAFLDGNVPSRSELFMECWGWERLTAVRTKRSLAILDDEHGQVSFFDLAADPGETSPLPLRTPAARKAAKRVRAFRERLGAGATPPALDPEVVRRLRELGYAGD